MRDRANAAVLAPRVPLPELSVGLWVVLLSSLTILGADLLWVVAMGDIVRDTNTVPDGIPFASAPQVQWHNPIVLAQLLLSFVHGVGPWGLAASHLALVGLTLVVVVIESRRMGGTDVRTTVVVALVVLGCAAPFVIARLPDLSLVPFVVAVALMRRAHDEPGRAVWWLVPLFAVWGNLHGGVLVGLALLGVFLVLSRGAGRLVERVALGVASVLALLLNPAGLGTPAYYLGVLTNEAAARKSDLWAAPSLTNPLDVAMLLSVAVLLAMCRRRGRPLWEWVVVAGLLGGTLIAARHGVWLVLFLAPAAAAARRREGAEVPVARRRPTWWPAVVACGLVAAVLATGFSLSRRADAVHPPGADVVDAARAAAGGGAVLADEPVAETLAQAGIRVWASNPIDAFPRSVQADFLDFLDEGRVPPTADVEAVVVSDNLVAEVLAGGGWEEASRTSGYVVLRRTP